MKKLYSIFLGVILFCSFSHAEVFYVSTMGNDSNDGKSWATAFADVQKAIDAAASVATSSSPAQVWIAKGTYTNAGGTYNFSTTLNTAYVMKNNVEIYGGFAGTETKLDERVSANKTILTTTGDYVFYNTYPSSNRLTKTAKIDSVTVTGAKSCGIYNCYSGPTITNCTIAENGYAGIDNQTSSSPTITNCTISGNGRYGIFNSDSSPTITNCTISGNGSSGILNHDSSPTITNCTISDNADDGIYNETYSYVSISPTITDCTISGNGRYGIYNATHSSSSISPTITNCTISDNDSYGIYNATHSSSSISPTITNCTIFRNGGSGIYNYAYASDVGHSSSIAPIITDCAISRNGGSGIYNKANAYASYDASSSSSITPRITNCTISDNADDGIYNYAYASNDEGYFGTKASSSISPTITNCTISDNASDGIYNSPTSSSKYTTSSISTIITNCIIWGNTSHQIYNNSSSKQNPTYCIIQGGYSSGNNIITGDPLLGELGNYGGTVDTIPVLKGSPAIGAGKSGENIPTTDARGVNRANPPTIGAYEYIEPSILSQPKDIMIYSGYAASISIEAECANYPLNYQWQTLNDSGEWEDIEGANEETLDFENCKVELNGSKYRCVVANEFDGFFTISDEVTLTVKQSVSEVTLSTDRITIVDGGYAHLEVSTDAIEPTYKWSYSTDSGASWIEIEGETSSILSFQADSSMNRRLYKCEVTDGGGTSVMSGFAALIINSNAIVIDENITDHTVIIGNTVDLQVKATSSGTIKYQWQISTDGGLTWLDIDGATNATYPISPEDYSLDGNLYRCKIDNGGGYIYSNTSQITVFKNVEITTQPADVLVWNNKSAQFEVSATGDGTISYQWQVSKAPDVWEDIEGANNAVLNVDPALKSMDGYKYRCVVSNEGGSVNSTEAILTVYKTLEITTQPKDTYTFEGDDTTFLVEVDAQGDVSYQWQVSTDSGSSWSDIADATSPTLTVPNMQSSMVGTQYKVIIENGGDEFVSNIATLYQATELAIVKQPQIIPHAYVGTTVSFTIEVEGSGAELQWYVSGNYGADTPTEIAGETEKTLNLLVSESTVENVYFCKVRNSRSDLESARVYIENVSVPTKYQSWAYENNLTGENARPEAMPHSDGITNLEKFTFGLDASKATSYSESGLFKQTNNGSNVSFQYPVNKDASDLTVKAFVSEDLIHWTEATATKTGESGNMNLFEVNEPLPDTGRLFFKVEVTQ